MGQTTGNALQLCSRLYGTCRTILFVDAQAEEQRRNSVPNNDSRRSLNDEVPREQRQELKDEKSREQLRPLKVENPRKPRQSLKDDNRRKKILGSFQAGNLEPCVVGIGCVFAAFGSPLIAKSVRDMVLIQGQRQRMLSLELPANPPSLPMSPIDSTSLNPLTSRPPIAPLIARTPSLPMSRQISQLKQPFTTSPSLEELHEGSAFSFKNFLQKTASNPAIIARADPTATLLSTHHIHSELHFITSLIEISNRLPSVPKPIRQSTLIAELSLLNHNLPAEVYIPLWKEHSVARICLGECVVLNSAERVPYLMIVEVFEKDGIDSDPISMYGAESFDLILTPMKVKFDDSSSDNNGASTMYLMKGSQSTQRFEPHRQSTTNPLFHVVYQSRKYKYNLKS